MLLLPHIPSCSLPPPDIVISKHWGRTVATLGWHWGDNGVTLGQHCLTLQTCFSFLQVDTVLLDSDVTFPNTAGIKAAATAAARLTSTLSSNPGQVYTASGAALLASAVVVISNVSQTSSLPVVVPPSQIPPGPAPVQFLLTEDLVSMHSIILVLFGEDNK